LQKGANKHLKDNRGRTPYDLAMEKNKFQIGEMLKDKNFCQLCIVKMPLEKVEKNKTNIIFFYSIHILLEPLIIGVSASCKNKFKIF
jgi:ankyrin repeat protein